MYLKYFYCNVLFIFKILHLCLCELDNLVDGQSPLGLVFIADANELEFILKDRTVNDSIKIEPTKTVILNNNGLPNETQEDTYTQEESSGVVWDRDPIPNVNAFYSFDQSAVQILLDYVKVPENIQKLSRMHLQLIKKYVYEWFELIQEPLNEDGKMNEELEIINNHIPKSMGFHDIVLKNIIRVQIDLQKIMDYSNEIDWKEHVVDKISEAETFSGIDIYQEGLIEAVSSSLAQLSRTYNLHPFELYPRNLAKDDSFLSLMHAALNMLLRQYMSVALEWFAAAKSLLKDDVNNVWNDILRQNVNLPKSLQTEENYWSKLRTLRESYEREKEDYVKEEIGKLNRIFQIENNSEEQTGSNCKKTEYTKDEIDFIYLDVISNISANMHDEIFNEQETWNHYGSFSRSLKKESLYTQTSKEAKEIYIRNFPKTDYDHDIKIKQDKLCRGIGTKSTREMSTYFCRLDTRNSPYLLLMPVKVEELNKDPEVMIFHHVVGDKKIHEFQQMALPIAAMARIGDAFQQTGMTRNVMVRKSYVAWLHELSSPKVLSLNHLVSHLTGFIASNELDGSESLQVNSYVSGGFYIPHLDAFNIFANFFDDENKLLHETIYYEKHSKGDRLATFMIYFNDDMIGGRTVFPHLGLSSPPERGSAIYWRNLYLNGSLHEQTLHAGCQVLAGTKWVANKWILSNAQMLREKCALEKNM